MTMTTIMMDTESVARRGDNLGKVWWQGRQWAVTEHGIECRDGTYYIAADRLTEERHSRRGIPSWPPHVCGKTWVDGPDFCTAFIVALVLHGHGDYFTPAQIEQACKKPSGSMRRTNRTRAKRPSASSSR